MATRENWHGLMLGGAEVSAKNLGEELLRLGHDVTYYFQFCEPFDDGSLHVRSRKIEDSFDAFICVRPSPILSTANVIPAKKKLLWSGDAFDQPSNQLFDDPVIASQLDAFVFKTFWQREKILERFGHIDKHRTYVITNGVREEAFKRLTGEPKENRFIYASTWYRGMFNFIKIWPEIRKIIPDAEIHAFGMTSLYFPGNPSDQQYFQVADMLAGYPGFVLRYPVPQHVLAQEIRKSWLMLYPNSGFLESSCGVALQSMAAGTPVLTTARAGLVETVGRHGILIKEREGWEKEFARRALCQKQLRNQLSNSGRREVLKKSTWRLKAKQWEDFLGSL
jgi:glycosyltransferase involved in cell wall biosynthesis